MDRIDAMRLFVRIVERGSFTAAAEDLQVPRATVTDAVKKLEARLGTRLLERTTRHVSPTMEGVAYHARCVQLLADFDDAENALRAATPKGLLRVDVLGALAAHFLMPALPGFLARHPGLALHIGESDRFVDLVREGYDCVVRAGVLQDSSLVGRRVADLEQITVASPAYLARHGVPKRPADLADGHQAVNFISSASGRAYPLEFTVKGTLEMLELPGPLSVTGTEIYLQGALGGLGLVQAPRYRIEKHLAAGELVQVLEKFPPPRLPVSVVYPQSRHLAPRVRVFADWVAEVFAAARKRSGNSR